MTVDARASAAAAAERIGKRLATLRASQNMRVSELARSAGVSSSLISQIERGNSRPSVGTLFAISSALEVPVDSFFVDAEAPAADAGAPSEPPPRGMPRSRAPGELTDHAVALRTPQEAGSATGWSSHESREPYVVRAGERASLDVQGGVRWERLTPTALEGVEFLELVYAPGAESAGQSYRHPGVELVLVTKGTMTISVGFERYDLEVDDSIAFPSSIPHRYVNQTDTEARAITVILRDDLSTLGIRDPGDGPVPGLPPADGNS